VLLEKRNNAEEVYSSHWRGKQDEMICWVEEESKKNVTKMKKIQNKTIIMVSYGERKKQKFLHHYTEKVQLLMIGFLYGLFCY